MLLSIVCPCHIIDDHPQHRFLKKISLTSITRPIAYCLYPLECRRYRLSLPPEETHPPWRRRWGRPDPLAGDGHRHHHLCALGRFLDLAARDPGRRRGHHLRLLEPVVARVYSDLVSHWQPRDCGHRLHGVEHVSCQSTFRLPSLHFSPPLFSPSSLTSMARLECAGS